MLKAGGEDISMATIYRNLGQLEEAGLVQRIIAGGPDRFDADMTKHYHAICTACGKTFDIFSDDMPDVCAAANRQGNIEVTDVRMIFGGMCKTCREKQQ